MANIVVTGSSRGLGLEFVRQLAQIHKTSNVFALCRNPGTAEKLHSVAKVNTNIKIIKADMTDFNAYTNVVSNIQQNIKNGGVNLLINNAGMMVRDTIKDVTKKNILDHFELNSLAPLLFTKTILPLLKNADGSTLPLNVGKSAVLNISAHLGSIEENTNGGYISYRISKAALNMITRSMSVELKCYKIFVMALHPGWVKTDMGGEAAPLTPEASVSGMLAVLAKANDSNRGYLYNSLGKQIPW